MAEDVSTCPKCFKMLYFKTFVVTTLVLHIANVAFICVADDSVDDVHERFLPTVSISVLVRNKAHCLPWFLGHIERLDYPKNRINLWFRSDHNKDNSSAMLREWVLAVEPLYHQIDVDIDVSETGYSQEKSNTDWTEERFDNVIKLREEALNTARDSWADYIFMLDADVILENNHTLQILMAENKTLVGPMLNTSLNGIYSNFWGGMTEDGYYKRTAEYVPIVAREKHGCFEVPMVHSALLIDLRHKISAKFSYAHRPEGYQGPLDDIIIFAHTVKHAGAVFHVVNKVYFGTIQVPLDDHYNLDYEQDQFTHTILEAMVEGPPFIPLYRSPHVTVPDIVPTDKLGMDEIYMVNLLRRPERRNRMMESLKHLGIKVKVVNAVDGKKLNTTYLDSLGIDMLPGYEDPYSHRALTYGEIGCFLSHYFIWQEVIEKGYEKIIVMEDDVRFEPYFKKKFDIMMREADSAVQDWEIIYLGRKILQTRLESLVKGTETLVWPSYSYWTLSYVMTRSGIQKLLAQKPLHRMIPVDEFLPIMFDKHPQKDWLIQFEPRNLVGLSAEPLLVFPTHYTGEFNYISDTEESGIIEMEEVDEEVGAPQVENASGCPAGKCVHDEF